MKNKKIILIIGAVALVTGCYFSQIVKDNRNIKEKEKEQEQALKCYKWLYDYDDIATGCEKYFQHDTWYQEYIKEEKGREPQEV